MEFVKLEPYNRIQTTKLTGDQVRPVMILRQYGADRLGCCYDQGHRQASS